MPGDEQEKKDTVPESENPAESAKPSEGASRPEMVHEDPDSHKADLALYLKATSASRENNTKFAEEMAKLIEETPENIMRIRRAGLDKDSNDNDRLNKYALLSSAYMEQESNKDNMAFTVNFRNSELAEKYVGAGDLLPPNVESIMVMDDKGNVLSKKAVRDVNDRRRKGYYDAESGQYVPVHTGYRIVVLSTRTDTDPSTGDKNKPGFIADPVLERRKLSEDIDLFNDQNSNTDREDVHVGLDGKAPPSVTKEEADQHQLPEQSNSGSDVERGTISKEGLKQQGYSPLKRVTPAVTREAVRCLKKGGPIDTVHYLTIDGVRYAFHREWHKHAASDRRPDGSMLPPNLYRRHHGITVYAA